MHRAAFALAITVAATEQLSHHALDVGAFGDAMAMAAVIAYDAIGGPQIGADADRDSFFATVRVHNTVDPILTAKLQGQLFEVANQYHLAIHLNARVGLRLNTCRGAGVDGHTRQLSRLVIVDLEDVPSPRTTGRLQDQRWRQSRYMPAMREQLDRQLTAALKVVTL
jgi:hypothetical protein